MAKQDGLRAMRRRIERLRTVHDQLITLSDRARSCADDIQELLQSAEEEVPAVPPQAAARPATAGDGSPASDGAAPLTS